MNPKPPSNLNKETIGVWQGWGNIGDREVTREAATKGLHIKLAIEFLSTRRFIKLKEAEIWFKEEVVKWVFELLESKQIFKASHVLSNIRLDPITKFSQIFYTTSNTQLREYIGNHLMEINKLDENLEQLWFFLNLILEKKESIILPHKLQFDSIHSLSNCSDQYKSEVATILFLKTDDVRLTKFLNSETLWKCLLDNKDLDNLESWINVRYNSDLQKSDDVNIIKQFRRLSITNEMLSSLARNEYDISQDMICTILNKLCQFGIFVNEDRKNLLKILQRLKNSFHISNLHDILAKTSSTVSVNNFFELLIDYCLDKKLLSIMSVCIKEISVNSSKSNDLCLINDFRLLINDISDIRLKNNILTVLSMLSDNITYYMNSHPVILFSLILFTQEIDIVNDVAKNALPVKNVNLTNCFLKMLDTFCVLKAVFDKKLQKMPNCDSTVYDLINYDISTGCENLFEFRINNCKLPHFNDEKFAQQSGYVKKINHKFYLKQCKPSIAVKFFILKELQMYGFVKEDEMKRNCDKAYKLAIVNFDHAEIVSGCIGFIEAMGLSAHSLRVMIEVAKILQKSGFSEESVLELILNNDDEPYTLQINLENILIESIESNSFLTGFDLLSALKIFEVAVLYSNLNNLKFPETFLKYCAGRNLWLPFLIFAQIHCYPLDQIKLYIQFFKSPNMLEHLTHGVVNDIRVEEKNMLIRDRDTRNYLLSKVGLRKNIDTLNPSASSSIKSQISFESEGSSTSSDFFEIDVCNIKATLLQTLIRCHNSTDPPKALLQACQLYRNPLLAIFATSYEPDSVIINWLTWLGVSCELSHIFTNYESIAVSANAVSTLLENCLRSQFPRTLMESFEIFLSDNPLIFFIELLNEFHKMNLSNNLVESKIKLFQVSLKTLRKNSIITETDHEMTYLNNGIWSEMTALQLLSLFLDCNCNSLHAQILIMETLCKTKMWTYFVLEWPNFNNILNILTCLYHSNSGIKLNFADIFNPKNRREAIISCINFLLEKQHYSVALKIAEIEHLPPDLILIKEWQNKISDRNGYNFWRECEEVFLEYNVTADCVVEFYLECSTRLSDLLEKFTLLKLASEWASKYELSCQYEIEKKMWISFLYLDEKHRDPGIFTINSSLYLYKDLIEILKNVTPHEEELNKDFELQLEDIVELALNRNNFWLAVKLQKMFNCKNSDLEILKLSHSLAEGILLPHQLNAQQRLLLSNAHCRKTYSHRRTFLSARFSGLSSASHSPANSLLLQGMECVDSFMNDTLAILKLLSEHLHSGINIAHNIFMKYRISVNIEIPYQVVVMTIDYMKMLKDALEDNCSNKLDVVLDFIMVYKWSKHEIADFICEELITAITNYIQSNTDSLTLWDLDLDQDFHLILQLLQDSCSILGHKIYAYLSTLYKMQIESNCSLKTTELALVTELLIRSHDCFTADCNMEGISIILQKTKEIIANLLLTQDWRLIVRLLTGVARYTEMNYVFQILMENDQFEFLLRKGLKKDNTLKVALLEYLKRYCPDNGDLYKIVALHFTLFSEVAMLWEQEAQNIIKNLISVSKMEMQNNKLNPDEEPFILFQNTESTKICLHKAMENYIHATEFHLQGEKLSKAMTSAKQAELIALQLSLINEIASNASTTCLLNLFSGQIMSLMSFDLNFEQSLILVEAYNFQPDWAAVLYEQYITNNNMMYLQGFLDHFPLTDTLVQDICRRFVLSNVNSLSEVKYMKNIINRLPSLQTKYRLASELGFIDLVEDFIASGQLVYLKDTVWKKGYKN